ncbi:uncharacterized protein LOC117332837 [Pecten maximus]|uniref:uncharacterized protein LOC117332837 n=1 Tax=Pecten maximus TaxID=6579 RepID=UPI001457E753|nr:uncharacterized protein LOC117332837 [Pecten maximus]
MATNMPTEVISIHNDMVLELSDNMTGPELDRLKHLLGDDTLTPADKEKIETVQQLFICLMDKIFISYGNYEKLIPKLKRIKPSLCLIVNRYTKERNTILKLKEDKEEIVISMDRPVYTTKEGSEASFLTCTVHPVPENIEWRKDKSTQSWQKVLSDNRKYFYGEKTPTLVIRYPNKPMDEGNYQCMAETRGKEVAGDIVHLKVLAKKSKIRKTTTNMTRQSDDPIDRSETEDQSQPAGGKRATVCQTDQGSRMFFNVNTDIDITRQASETDISDTFTRVTRQSERLRKAKLKKKCIQVCLDITAARSASEPSSLHLAEEFKHYLLEGGTIQLTDESQTVLQIVKDSFEITPETTPEDGSPYVNISHSQFTVPVGKTAIIQTYVISSSEVTSIQWFKKEDDEDIPIAFDNKQYFGGSILSPTLIIRKTTISDHGQYLCTATNCNGTGLSNMTVLSLQSGKSRTL